MNIRMMVANWLRDTFKPTKEVFTIGGYRYPVSNFIGYSQGEAGALFYAREVDRGELLTMFGDAEELRLLVEAAGAQWLYSEDLG
jgi:hypothetical protein